LCVLVFKSGKEFLLFYLLQKRHLKAEFPAFLLPQKAFKSGISRFFIAAKSI